MKAASRYYGGGGNLRLQFTKRLQELVDRGLSQDADRRFRFVRVAQYAEEIAFLRGEQAEATKIENVATSRLSCVSIETCADEVDFQVDLRLT